jgi:hypothetical protein
MRSNRSSCSVVLVLFLLGAAPDAFCQATTPSSSQSGIRDEEMRLYAGAKPYLDDSIPELEKKVRELKGLKPASGQEHLSDLLHKIGLKVDELVKKVPDLTSEENVILIGRNDGQQDCALAHAEGESALPNGCPSTAGLRRQKVFHYLILSRQTKDGRVLEELRTDEQNHPVEPGAGGPNFQGMVGSWLFFSPSNRAQSRFRYLGEQKSGKRQSFVVAFAQIPGAVNLPMMMMDGGGSIPLLLQGIAWVDQEDFRILEIRTDILSPLPAAGWQKQTAKILFGPIGMSQHSLELWLPIRVDVSAQVNGLAFQEQHVYSNYRMFHATSRMLP